MKIIVFGTKTITRKKIQMLSNQGFEVTGTPSGMDELSTLLSEMVFDLAVVNSGSEEAQQAFKLLNRRGVPVIFTVGARADWQKLNLMDACAYIPEGVGEAEFIARWKAVYRRLSLPNDGNKTADRGDTHELQVEGMGN